MKINDCFCDNVNFSQQINRKGWPKLEKNENRSNKNANRDDCKWSFLKSGQQEDCYCRKIYISYDILNFEIKISMDNRCLT